MQRTNIGYVITDSITIGETEFVIGAHEKDPNRFVTWACSKGDNYYWGHYLTSREAAEKDLVQRATEQLQLLDSIRNRPKETNQREAR